MKCPRCGGEAWVRNIWVELGIVKYAYFCPRCGMEFVVEEK
jgi:ribosomal protein S27AE